MDVASLGAAFGGAALFTGQTGAETDLPTLVAIVLAWRRVRARARPG